METLLAIVLAYLLGSIPTGAIAGRIRGVDLRKEGSGNLGATNALRVLGPKVGIPVLAVDVAKGVVAVLAIGGMVGVGSPLGPDGVRLLAGLAAVAGHIVPVFAGFRGGKGVATACGVFLAMAPLATLAAIVVWLAVVLATRYVSLGSIAAAVLLPFAVLGGAAARHEPRPTAVAATAAAVAVIVVFRHRSNIRRLASGTENRLAFGRSPREGGS